MALGIPKKRVKPAEKVNKEEKEQFIQKKVYNLANAIKIPAPINQFKTQLEGVDLERAINLLKKYTPETKLERYERLKSENPNAGPKPMLLKFGLRHIVDLLEQKKLGFLAIAADVAPITLVIGLPTLCKKMNIPYCIVPSKQALGALVHLKSSAVVGIEQVRPEDSAEFSDIIRISNALFLSQYEKHMTTIGGRIAKKAEL